MKIVLFYINMIKIFSKLLSKKNANTPKDEKVIIYCSS